MAVLEETRIPPVRVSKKMAAPAAAQRTVRAFPVAVDAEAALVRTSEKMAAFTVARRRLR
jgi:hypothetical protein